MVIEYRPAEPSEHAAAIDTISSAFLDRPDAARVAEFAVAKWEPGRLQVALDAGKVVGTFRTWGTELTVPGLERLPAAAVTGVTVRPTHHRRGILRGLVAAEHAATRERGEAVAVLYASEYPIYGRFGYGPATRWATWTVETGMAEPLGPVPGGVELVAPDAALIPVIAGVFDRVRLAGAGEVRRRDFTWPLRLGLEEEPWGDRWKGFLLIRRDAAGNPDGFVRYTGKHSWTEHIPRSTIEVQEIVAATDEAYAALWGYLVGMDLVGTIAAEGLREHERLPWLLRNARAARPSAIGEGLWVRLFDVPRALEARTYERTGELVVEVVDAELAGGRARWRLVAGPDGATCHRTDLAADITLPVAALGGAYLGGTPLRDVVVATGADEHRPGAILELDALLRTIDTPYCSTFF